MPNVIVTLHVKNTADNSPVVGARVFIDGSANFDPNQFTVATNSAGTATFQFVSNLGTKLMQLTADGFQDTTQVILTDVLVQSLNLTMTPNAPSSQVLNLQFIPQVPGIVWSITGPTPANGVSIDNGSSTSLTPVLFGSYTLTATLTGFQSLNVLLIVNGQTDPYTFGFTKNDDPNTQQQQGNTNGDSSQPTSQPASIVSQVSTEPPAQSEFIYPNSDYDKYFTTIAARIYIGNLFIDELNSIQYAMQDNAVPVYGYASRFVDAYGQGRSLVQGQLAINFVTEGYLFTVMQEYKRYLANTQTQDSLIDSPKIDLVAQTLGLMATRDSLLQQANNNPNDTTSEIRAGQIQAQISAKLNAMSSDQVALLNNQRERQLKTFNDVIGFDNAVYQDVLFDIRIELGNEVTGVRRVRYLEKCKLISNEQIMDQSGQVILDSYGFLCRRLR